MRMRMRMMPMRGPIKNREGVADTETESETETETETETEIGSRECHLRFPNSPLFQPCHFARLISCEDEYK